jgi:methionyl-tRNA formyltransferase
VLAAGDALVVACGDAALAITELQRAGGRALPAAEFLRGRVLPLGARLE